MDIIWHGTASIELVSEGRNIFFDPFVPLAGSSTVISGIAYDGAREIFVTHGHIDHISSLPGIAGADAVIHCTQTPAGTLKAKGIRPEQIKLIAPGERLFCEGFEIEVFQARHISFDRKIVTSTLFCRRFFRMFSQALVIGRENRICRENGETVGYLIQAEGTSVFLMGSLALDESVSYPEGTDLLVLPYQGSSSLLEPAKDIIGKLKPKAVFLDHFDDTFPPVSRDIDTKEIEEYLKGSGIPVIRPEADRRYSL